MVGNKCDIDEEEEREVTFDEGLQWVKDYVEDDEEDIDINFIEVSAKEGTNITTLFDEICMKLLERHNKAKSIGGGVNKGKYVLADPTQNISMAYKE